MKNSRYAWLLRLLLFVVAAAGIASWYGSAHDRLQVVLHHERYTRAPFTFDDDTGVVTQTEPEASRAGLMKGARLRSLNGGPYTGDAQWDAIIHAASPGDELIAAFTTPQGAERTAVIRMEPLENPFGAPVTQRQVWQNFFVFSLLPLVCMLVGYWIVFVKPDETNAWLLLVLLVFPSVIFSYASGLAAGWWLIFRVAYYELFQSLAPLALLPFALYFPERWRLDIRYPWLKWIILTPAFACAALDIRQTYGRLFEAGNPAWLRAVIPVSDTIVSALYLLCVGLYFLIFVDKLRHASSPDVRRRLRVLLAGTSAGIAASLVVYVLVPALGYLQTLHHHPWIVLLGAVVFLLAPFTLAYVVLVQRAMDVRVLLRQGTRYALARASLWVIQAAIIGVLVFELLPSRDRHNPPEHQAIQVAVFIGLIVFIRVLVNKRAREWVDRKFFREAYDAEQLLNELAEEVRAYTESRPLLETVSRRVADTLHVRSIAMLLRDEEGYCVAQAMGVGQEVEKGRLLLTSSTVRKLTNERQPLHLYRNDPDAWYMLAGHAEKKVLDRLGAELLLPLPGRNGLMGIMTLGPKQSEAAFSRSDLQLLQAVATQTGLALEVGELAHSLATAAAQRERALRELELAREVQERLFPQRMPEFANGTVAGACRPAQSVGGDYYDVFPLEDGRLGIAIGDVSGKGISAALLMASLRASMRGLAYEATDDFGTLMSKVNRLVCEASSANRFATLFFAIFDPATGALECVNAGHNPPLVLRTRDGLREQEWLAADGPVVGILEGAAYCAKKLTLAPGDVLVAYTDGVSEAMTRRQEEWGEERLLAAAWRSSEGRAGDVVEAVFTDADAFTAGAAQHDDMTMLVLKIEPQPA